MGTAEYHKERSVLSNEGDEVDDEKYKTPVEVHRKMARYSIHLAHSLQCNAIQYNAILRRFQYVNLYE